MIRCLRNTLIFIIAALAGRAEKVATGISSFYQIPKGRDTGIDTLGHTVFQGSYRSRSFNSYLTGEDVVAECDFESTTSCTVFLETTGAYRWQTASGFTMSIDTGPDVDHTYGTDKGTYAYVEASQGNRGDSAVLNTVPHLADRRDYCLSLWYNMNGKDIAEFHVVYVIANVTTRGYFLLREKGNQGNTWRHLYTDIEAVVGDYFSIAIKAVRGNGYRGDIAVDDFRLIEGQCYTKEFPKLDDFLLVADSGRGQIFQMDLRSGDYKAIFIQTSPVGRPGPLAYSYQERRVYWGDLTKHLVGSVYLDGSGYKEYFLGTAIQIEGIAVDPSSQTIYFTDSRSGSVQTIDMQSKRIQTLIDVGLVKPRGIALDLSTGYIYVTDYGGATPGVYRAGLSGRGLQHLVKSNIIWPNGITLDLSGQRMYWTDGFRGTCVQGRLDGSDRRELWRIGRTGQQVNLFDLDCDLLGNLYISNWNSTHILKSPTDGNRPTQFGPPIFHQAMGVAVVRGQKQQNPGKWGIWSSWGACSKTCGLGMRQKRRTCNGSGCHGSSSQTEFCQEPPCPSGVNIGTWNQWGSWGQCSASCGPGQESRTRTCRGRDCRGQGMELRRCEAGTCPGGDWSSWSSWGACSKTCGTGMRKRRRTCKGSICYGDFSEKQFCQEPPCKGNWYSWGSWTSCSVSCDEGIQTRYRVCRNLNCKGRKAEMKICQKPPCTGNWYSWGPWTSCSASCDDGVQKRYRICELHDCNGKSYEMKICRKPPCQGGWREWQDWGPCSSSCGVGQKYRFRPCDGANCLGDSDEWQRCNSLACP